MATKKLSETAQLEERIVNLNKKVRTLQSANRKLTTENENLTHRLEVILQTQPVEETEPAPQDTVEETTVAEAHPEPESQQ